MELRFFYRPLRVMMGDFDASMRKYPDGVIDDAARTVLQMGKLPGYSLTPDENSMTPDPATPAVFALMTLHMARLFVMPIPSNRSFRTRAFSRSEGNFNRFLDTLEADISRMESGDRFSGWQSYYSWLHGMAGLPLGEVLAQFDVQAPLWKATFTRDGMKVA